MPSKPALKTRVNRDTTYFGISPNGEYDFGGGTAYVPQPADGQDPIIHSQSGKHDLNSGDPFPDTLSSFLAGSPFVYTVAIAPPYFSSGPHIGPAAISRDNFSFYLQDTWKVTSLFTLDYGVRWDMYHAHHRARPPHIGLSQRERDTGVCRQSSARLSDRLAWLATAHSSGHGKLPASYLPAPEGALLLFRPISGRITSLPAPRLLPSIPACSPPPRSHRLWIPDHAGPVAACLYAEGSDFLRHGKHQHRCAQHGHGCKPL